MIRLAHRDDLPILRELWYENFMEHDSKESIDYYFENSFDLAHTFILEIAGEIVTSLQLNQHILLIGGNQEDVSFVIGVATFKQHQRKGYMRILLDYAIDYAKNTLNQKLMILQAYNWDIYRPFGFEESYFKNNLHLSSVELNENSIVKLIDIESNKLLEIYEKYTKKLNGYKIRSVAYFDMQLEMMKIDGIKVACSKDAYIFYLISENILEINECAYISRDSILDLIKTISEDNKVEQINMKTDIYNFEIQTKELFMMTKKLSDINLGDEKQLYISELI